MARDSTEAPAIRKAQTDFYDALAAINVKPDTLSSLSWDVIFVVVDALRHTPENPTPKQIHDYIEKVNHFPGINGFMNYTTGNQRGVDANAAMMVRYDAANTAWVPVSKPGGLPL
jgi:hypothetical protein